jgi:hypothetical protein
MFRKLMIKILCFIRREKKSKKFNRNRVHFVLYIHSKSSSSAAWAVEVLACDPLTRLAFPGPLPPFALSFTLLFLDRQRDFAAPRQYLMTFPRAFFSVKITKKKKR